jgi:hypothetical protein
MTSHSPEFGKIFLPYREAQLGVGNSNSVGKIRLEYRIFELTLLRVHFKLEKAPILLLQVPQCDCIYTQRTTTSTVNY